MPDGARGGRGASRRPYMGIGHSTDLTRQIDIRDQRWTVLVLTNGERTEFDYFNGIRDAGMAGPGKVMIVKFRNGSPSDTVRSAAGLRDYSEYDEAWAVCDVDEFDVQSAIETATARGINLALSQPCFEVWLILHKTASCPGFDNAAQVSRVLRKHVQGWDKGRLSFADFARGILLAVERAQRLGEPPEANPSTAVWRLIASLGVGQERGEEGMQETLS